MTEDYGETITPDYEYDEPIEEKKDNKVLIIVLVVLIVLCCCCSIVVGGGWWLWENGDDLFDLAVQSSHLFL